MTAAYDEFSQNPANHVALSPLSFLQRSAEIFPQRVSLVYNQRQFNWSQTYQRCKRIASSLAALNIGHNDTVSVFAFNTPEMLESHFSVPMTGAVLNAINTRLDAATVAYIIDHGESRLIMVDRQLWPVLQDALQLCELNPDIILIDDPDAEQKPELPAEIQFTDYEQLVTDGDEFYQWQLPEDEWHALALNYTSGTTGKPKGVVYHHRGSYLMTMGTVLSWGLPSHPRYLYTVPMFHCNGWGHAWTMTAIAATIYCVRSFSPAHIFNLIQQHSITHFGGAPIILNMLVNAPESKQKKFDHKVKVMTAGAPPPPAVLNNMEQMGFEVLHVYGLTETYGHILLATPQQDWDQQAAEKQAELKSRQGVRFAMTEAVDVIHPESGQSVPWDAQTMGEIVIRGNTVMKGYLKDHEATQQAFDNGWFNSGDLAVVHPDGYIQIKDRAKDIIISGGENISSVEIESTMYHHPAVAEAAVVALADETWGEVPCAFVELKTGSEANEEELIEFCKQNMARYKRPKKIIFGALPKTSTGKIQKNRLRERTREIE